MDDANSTPSPALCFCGRPARHMGRHKGMLYPAAPPKPTRGSQIAALVEKEISACHATIARITGQINALTVEVSAAKANLPLLIALHDNYRVKTWPPPRATAPPPVSGLALPTPALSGPRPASPMPTVEAAPADFAPVEADFGQIVAWAAARGIEFRSWDDLPKINNRREALELPCFKRKFARTAAGRN